MVRTDSGLLNCLHEFTSIWDDYQAHHPILSLGAPIDITPLKDNPQLAADNSKNNDFRFAFPGDQQNQDRCPFGAHIRKTNPRADLEDLAGEGVNEPRRIMRRGIQFGPEMSHQEAEGGKTLHERGLLFACYQSQLTSGGKPNGFRFIQQGNYPIRTSLSQVISP